MNGYLSQHLPEQIFFKNSVPTFQVDLLTERKKKATNQNYYTISLNLM